MKKSIEIVEQLKKYFGVVVIGTQLIVDEKLLHESDTTDIDVAVVFSTDITGRIKQYLKDFGFTGKDILRREDIYSEEVLIRTEYTNPEFDKPIDLNYFKSKPEVKTISEIIRAKFERGAVNDLKQISMIVFNKAGSTLKSIKELQEFYDQNKPNGETIE